MTRDWNLIRELLLEIRLRNAACFSDALKIDGFSKSKIAEHVLLMQEMRLIEGRRTNTKPDDYLIAGLTSEGERALQLIRDDNTWAAIETIAKRFEVRLTADTIILIAYYLASQSC